MNIIIDECKAACMLEKIGECINHKQNINSHLMISTLSEMYRKLNEEIISDNDDVLVYFQMISNKLKSMGLFTYYVTQKWPFIHPHPSSP